MVPSGRSRRRQQIGGTKRPQNAEMPLNGCNSELTTRWLASAWPLLPRDRLASQLARKREGEGCMRGGQINFDGTGSRGRSHREKATTISGISQGRSRRGEGASARKFYELPSLSQIYLCGNIRIRLFRGEKCRRSLKRRTLEVTEGNWRVCVLLLEKKRASLRAQRVCVGVSR